jgi:GH24 family phage-related lysozyme (muramidase)
MVLAWLERNAHLLLTALQKVGIVSFYLYNIDPGKCFSSTFYKNLMLATIKAYVLKSGAVCSTATVGGRKGRLLATMVRWNKEVRNRCLLAG